MIERIDRRFSELIRVGRAALVTFTTVGDPDIRTSLAITKPLPAVSSADMIVLGMPFTDPMTDESDIQPSGLRACHRTDDEEDLRNGTNVPKYRRHNARRFDGVLQSHLVSSSLLRVFARQERDSNPQPTFSIVNLPSEQSHTPYHLVAPRRVAEVTALTRAALKVMRSHCHASDYGG